VGVGVGVTVALAGSRLLGDVLFGPGPWDPLTYAAALAVLLGAGVAASIVPALRAARVDPVSALRQG
jgi:ABC-type antimicrobial peptide transport system permease subunit